MDHCWYYRASEWAEPERTIFIQNLSGTPTNVEVAYSILGLDRRTVSRKSRTILLPASEEPVDVIFPAGSSRPSFGVAVNSGERRWVQVLENRVLYPVFSWFMEGLPQPDVFLRTSDGQIVTFPGSLVIRSRLLGEINGIWIPEDAFQITCSSDLVGTLMTDLERSSEQRIRGRYDRDTLVSLIQCAENLELVSLLSIYQNELQRITGGVQSCW